MIEHNIDVYGSWAASNPLLCEEFSRGHEDVLISLGIVRLTSADKSWHSNKNTYLLLVKDGEDILAGARLKLYDGELSLPIETAICEVDSKILDFVKSFSSEKTGEVCGIWTSKKAEGKGLAFFLVNAIISFAKQEGLNSLFALCSPYTVSMFSKMGFQVIKSVGKNGTFYYPKLDLIATAMNLTNLKTYSAKIELQNDFINFSSVKGSSLKVHLLLEK